MKKTKQTVIGIGLFITVIYLISISSSMAVIGMKMSLLSVLKLPLKTAYQISYDTKEILKWREFSKENKRLRSNIDRLTAEITKLKEASIENVRLRGLLSFKQEAQYELIPAVVIGQDSSNWSHTVMIDRGKDCHIRPDMVVVSVGGLIGKIMEVGPNTSRILLITDPSSRIAALIQESREMGLVCGGVNGRCRMNYLSLNADIKIGEKVVSSGIGGVFPKGLSIGTVVKVEKDPSKLYQYAEISPTVNISKLEEVLIIVR